MPSEMTHIYPHQSSMESESRSVSAMSPKERAETSQAHTIPLRGAATGNARLLHECSRVIKVTLAKADRSEDGTWEIEDGI
jgi:hypothetical protein